MAQAAWLQLQQRIQSPNVLDASRSRPIELETFPKSFALCSVGKFGIVDDTKNSDYFECVHFGDGDMQSVVSLDW